MSVDIHAAISMLRHLSDEFKEARRIPVGERMEVAKSIGMCASATLRQCWNLGHLRSIPSLRQKFEDLRNHKNSIPGFLGDIWFEQHLLSNLVGYGGAVIQEVLENKYETNDEGEEIEYQESVEYFYLSNGILAKDRLLLTPELFLGPVWMSDGEIATAMSKHAFEVLGYYSQGCEVLASIIEREMASKQDDGDASGSACIDGVYRSDALLIWGGIRYEWLTDTMMNALELLAKRYPGKVTPSEMEHAIGRLPEGGFKKVFKFNRGGKTGMHPVVSLISGRQPQGWSLKK